MDNNLITKLFARINDAIDYKLSKQTQIKSAVVHSVNHDTTVNIQIPPGSTVYHNIQNQSIYGVLRPGDNVKVIVEGGNLSNMWIIGGFNLSKNINELIYPIGSIYMSINDTDPAVLFGGKWEKIEDRFLLSAGSSYTAGETGGSATHTLSVNEMPKHKHNLGYRIGGGSGSTWYIDGGTVDSWCGDDAVSSTGESQPHNNMPPYLTVYMWKRIQ